MNEAETLAHEAMRAWGGGIRRPRLVNEGENIVFQVWLPDGRTAALRLHRPGYQSRAAIEAELRWTAALSRAGLRVPEPLRTRAGDLTATAGDRVASCVGWLGGQAVGSAVSPLAGGRGEQAELFARIGALVGTLHRVTDALPGLAGLDRPRWDLESLLGAEPRWGRFWDNPSFSPDERAVIAQARTEARAALASADAGTDFGLIHADVMRGNILVSGDGLALIDFDDSGYGFRLYDLGTAIVPNLEEPALPDIVAALTEGYRQHRPAPRLAASDLALFVLLRTFASAGWIVTRARPDDPRQRLYAVRALGMARHFLAGTAPWD